MDTKEYLASIVPTVKDLLCGKGFKEENEILQIGNMSYTEDYDSYGNDSDKVGSSGIWSDRT